MLVMDKIYGDLWYMCISQRFRRYTVLNDNTISHLEWQSITSQSPKTWKQGVKLWIHEHTWYNGQLPWFQYDDSFVNTSEQLITTISTDLSHKAGFRLWTPASLQHHPFIWLIGALHHTVIFILYLLYCTTKILFPI